MMESRLNEAVYSLKRSAIREYSKLAKETPGCVALTLGEPDFDTPSPIIEEARASLLKHETHYIENNGRADLRRAIAAFETERHGFPCTEDQVIVTIGATEALFVALFGTINPGDEVIIPSPAFVLYEEIVKLSRGIPVHLDTSSDSFQIREDKLRAVVSNKTKAIVLNSPNNPTGAVLDSESLQCVRKLSKEKDFFVIADDVYRELVYTGTYHSFTEFPDVAERTLLVQSYSKPYAMTGWRVGYLIAPKGVKERLELVHQFCVVSVPAPFQSAAKVALDYDPTPLREVYRKRRSYVLSRLSAMGLEFTEPEGAFYVFPSISRFGLDSATFCRRMIKEVGLAATPGYCFGCEGHIRLTYCYSDEELKEGLDRLERFLSILEEEA